MSNAEGLVSPNQSEAITPPILVDTPATLQSMLADLQGERAIALDTESDSLYRYAYKVCLIQLSVPQADYLIDALALRDDLAPLGLLLADGSVEKVFHAAENDVLMLKRDHRFDFANIFDTMLAARILGWRRVGLAALLEEHFSVLLDKHLQLTDWGRRPLSMEQLSYAQLDSRYLLPLRDLLADQLLRSGRWEEAAEAFAALSDVTYVEKPFDPEGFWRSKGARDLCPAALAILRELYQWRDKRARDMDVPPFKVLDDRALMRISQDDPSDAASLPLSRWQISRFGREVMAAVQRGRAAPPPQQPARNQAGGTRPGPETVALYDRLRAWRAQRAADRGVDTDVVLTNEVLMSLARSAPDSLQGLRSLAVLSPWKLSEYGADIVGVVNGEAGKGS